MTTWVNTVGKIKHKTSANQRKESVYNGRHSKVLLYPKAHSLHKDANEAKLFISMDNQTHSGREKPMFLDFVPKAT